MFDLRDKTRELKIVEVDSGIRYESFEEYQRRNRKPFQDFLIKLCFFLGWLFSVIILNGFLYIVLKAIF